MNPLNDSHIIRDIRLSIDKLNEKGIQVTLNWVKAHGDIVGNQKAHIIAKAGAKKIAEIAANEVKIHAKVDIYELVREPSCSASRIFSLRISNPSRMKLQALAIVSVSKSLSSI